MRCQTINISSNSGSNEQNNIGRNGGSSSR